MIFGKTVPGPFRSATPSTTTFRSLSEFPEERSISLEFFAIIAAEGMGGSGGLTTGCLGIGNEVSGIVIEDISVLSMVFALEISCIAGGWIGIFWGGEGFVGISGESANRSVDLGRDATISPGESENLTNMGLDIR